MRITKGKYLSRDCLYTMPLELERHQSWIKCNRKEKVADSDGEDGKEGRDPPEFRNERLSGEHDQHQDHCQAEYHSELEALEDLRHLFEEVAVFSLLGGGTLSNGQRQIP
jgi:hypothetical protein